MHLVIEQSPTVRPAASEIPDTWYKKPWPIPDAYPNDVWQLLYPSWWHRSRTAWTENSLQECVDSFPKYRLD